MFLSPRGNMLMNMYLRSFVWQTKNEGDILKKLALPDGR